jgi:hypothetical protein
LTVSRLWFYWRWECEACTSQMTEYTLKFLRVLPARSLHNTTDIQTVDQFFSSPAKRTLVHFQGSCNMIFSASSAFDVRCTQMASFTKHQSGKLKVLGVRWPCKLLNSATAINTYSRVGLMFRDLFSVSVRVGWGRKEAHALRPFSDLLCLPICFIPPVVPYLWQSTICYTTECHHNRLVP